MTFIDFFPRPIGYATFFLEGSLEWHSSFFNSREEEYECPICIDDIEKADDLSEDLKLVLVHARARPAARVT